MILNLRLYRSLCCHATDSTKLYTFSFKELTLHNFAESRSMEKRFYAADTQYSARNPSQQ